jgi:Domain of unknown function (DUF6265)
MIPFRLIAPLIAGGVIAPLAGIDRIAWLQGCRESVTPRRVIEENWSAPRGKTMLGSGRTLRGDSLVEYELVLIREREGALVYEAHPSGQPSAVFTAREVRDSSVRFENLAHDSPQQVGYRRLGSDSLLAWIDGAAGGTPRRVEFRYARARCPGR